MAHTTAKSDNTLTEVLNSVKLPTVPQGTTRALAISSTRRLAASLALEMASIPAHTLRDSKAIRDYSKHTAENPVIKAIAPRPVIEAAARLIIACGPVLGAQMVYSLLTGEAVDHVRLIVIFNDDDDETPQQDA